MTLMEEDIAIRNFNYLSTFISHLYQDLKPVPPCACDQRFDIAYMSKRYNKLKFPIFACPLPINLIPIKTYILTIIDLSL